MHELDELEQLREDLIEVAIRCHSDIEEGRVSTTGPLPYRRLDAGGHVLAYLTLRPRRRRVRIDVPGRWSVPLGTPGAVAWAAGAASFWLEGPDDVPRLAQQLAGLASQLGAKAA